MKHIRLISSVYEGSKNPLDYLEDYEFSKLTYLSRYHLIMLIALARRQNRYLPNDPAWLQKQIDSPQEVDIKPYMGVWFESMAEVNTTYDKQGFLKQAGPIKHGDRVRVKGMTQTEAENFIRPSSDQIFDAETSFILAWSKYPAKIGKIKAEQSYIRMVKSEKDHGRLMKAMENYLGWLKDLSDSGNPRSLMDGKTFFNNWEADYEHFVRPEGFSGKGKESFQEAESRKFLEGENK